MTIERHEPDGLARWIHTAQPAAALAERIAETEFVPGPMRGKPAAVAACIMYGDEIGVGPMQALASIHVVDGRPFPSAELLRALILRDGHGFRVLEATGTRCRVWGCRRGESHESAVIVEWTIEMARAAGLAGKGAWRSYPRALLLARASTDLARMAFPDVVKGLGHVPDVPQVAEDWAELADGSGLPDDPSPEPTKVVQWTGARRPPPHDSPMPGAAVLPANDPEPVPWDEDPAPIPEAVETPTLPPLDTPEPVAADESERPADRENVRRIMAAYGDLGYSGERAERLALFSALLAQPVESTNDLERMSAYRLLGSLARLKDGTLIAIADGHGGFTIHAGQEPDEE